MTSREAQQELRAMLNGIYDPREAAHITELVLEDITGHSRIDRIMHEAEMSDEQEDKYRQYFAQLADATPVQYVLGHAWFMGQRFRVNEDVLIPRPETEELVGWIIEEAAGSRQQAGGGRREDAPITIIDIGTGSGCIPIMLKKNLPDAHLHAVDVSADALKIASSNAASLDADVHFHKIDILDESQWTSLPMSDIIVSNPPYVPLSDKQSMSPHVLEHEPHLALFVPDEDPLLFYRTIVQFAEKKLKPGGLIFFETHHELASKLMLLAGGQSELRKDLSGKDRMVKIVL
jgi:release factor glutamine methyltransferase